jgi:hypothetical protein
MVNGPTSAAEDGLRRISECHGPRMRATQYPPQPMYRAKPREPGLLGRPAKPGDDTPRVRHLFSGVLVFRHTVRTILPI